MVYKMRTKIKKFLGIFILAVFIVLILLPADIQAKTPFDPPFIHGYVSGTGDNLSAVITWLAEDQEELGFKIEKEYQGVRKTAAIYNPVMLGVNPTPSGFYLDQAIAEGDQYTYWISYFRRDGSEGELGRIELKIKGGLIKLSMADIENKKGNLALRWEAVEGAKNYEIFRDNELLGKTARTDFSDKKTLDGMHQYEIKAFSEENNISGLLGKAQAQSKEIASYNLSLKTEKGSLVNNYLLYILIFSGSILAVLLSLKIKRKI